MTPDKNDDLPFDSEPEDLFGTDSEPADELFESELNDQSGDLFPETGQLGIQKVPETFLGLLTNEDGEITKKTIKKYSEKVFQDICEHGNIFHAYGSLKVLENYISVMLEMMKTDTLSCISKMHKDERTFRGVKFEIRNSPGTKATYSFDHDDTWKKLQETLKDTQEKIQKREEAMLNAYNMKGEFVFEGEVIPPAKVKTKAKSGSETFQVTIGTA